MADETGYRGRYEITDRNRSPEDDAVECSCGVLVWDVAAHKEFHRSFGHLITDKREPA